MKEPKTIKGYIKLIKQIEKMSPTHMKGFDDIPEDVQTEIMFLSGEISNYINQIEIEDGKVRLG